MNMQSVAILNVEPHAERAGVTIRELAPDIRVVLRVGPGDRAEIGAAIGFPLPERIGARTVAGPRSALCLGPDEWLLATGEKDGPALTGALDASARRLPVSAVDVSDRELTFALAGDAACDVLSTGCPRDLARMEVGSGARTVFDNVQVVLTREAGDVFHLTVWRSFAPHVRALLDIAQREFAAGL